MTKKTKVTIAIILCLALICFLLIGITLYWLFYSPRELTAIHIDGGYGYLRGMSLSVNGQLFWSGWEPPRQAASLIKAQLTKKEVQDIWRLAYAVDIKHLADFYIGGDQTFKLTFVFSNMTKEVTIRYGEPDMRPEELKELTDALFKTRHH